MLASDNSTKWGYYANVQGWYVNTPVTSPPDLSVEFNPKALEEVVYEAAINDWITLEICCDGLFIFSFHDHPEYTIIESDNLRESAIKQINICRICNICSVLLRTAISNHEGYACTYKFITPSLLYNIRNGSTSLADDYEQTFSRRTERNIHNIDRRFYTVSETTLTSFTESLNAVVAHPDKAILTIIQLLNQSVWFYLNHDYANSLLSSWSINEHLLIQKRKKRDKVLAIIKLFKKQGAYTPEILDTLDNLRKIRNSWIHNLDTVDKDDAWNSISVCLKLIYENHKFDFRISTALSA